MQNLYQVMSDCPHCRVEAAHLERMDPSRRVGVPISSRCRLCGYATELGDITDLGHPFVDVAEVVAALTRWAEEEGESDVGVFCTVNFGGLAPSGVAVRVLAGDRVETSFDVIAWLFPGMSGGGSGRRGDEEPPRPKLPAHTPPAPAPTPTTARGPDPRDTARALVSVMMADGRIRAGERRFVETTLARLGAPQLDENEYRVWRPMELGLPSDPNSLVEAMRLLALVDREPDGSERRVLEEYARAWGVTLPENPLPEPSPMAAFGRALVGLFVG